ncbi:MAG: KEOPS complex kinase/ATPase Bud32 [Candidatus Woesearchaeota archaeon]
MPKIGDGAEAIIYLENNKVIKERIQKNYRLPEIDQKLRKFRTRREAKLLEKLDKLGFTPKLINSDDKTMKIQMQFIDAPRLRDVLNKTNYKKYCEEIGKKLAILHNNHIIHADLTTSNMLLKDQIYFIDFGLSYESHKIEDKAVDLHLLKQALESKHHQIFEEAFTEVLKSYKHYASQASEIIKRFEIVEQRGRNKSKGS